MQKSISRWLAGAALLCFSLLAAAQDKLEKPQLDQLMAPIALYPDALLSQMLMASTYPDDVKAAAQWSKDNSTLSGDAAVKAVEGTPWDPSVKSLVAFPSVMDLMARQPQWVQQVGDAFLAQPEDVMDSAQRLRRQAQEAGALKTNEQQKVVVQQQGPTQVIAIEPANPQVVYVPSYNPAVVYGAWPYPAYPPYYYPAPVGSVFATSCEAQSRYAQSVGQGKPASRIVSSPGRRDGLYWPAVDAPESPLGADALVMGSDTPVDAALNGYHYRLLPGDPKGCAFAAWPARYGSYGFNTFVIGGDGVVRERDLGAATNASAGRIRSAGEGWSVVQ